jgi:hypothetical protein
MTVCIDTLDIAKQRDSVPESNRRKSCEDCRQKFLRVFPRGFEGEKYLAWNER